MTFGMQNFDTPAVNANLKPGELLANAKQNQSTKSTDLTQSVNHLSNWARGRLDVAGIIGPIDANVMKLHDELLKNDSELKLDSQYTFKGTTIRNTKAIGMFEEGGISRQNIGTAMLITDDKGNKIPPQTVRFNYQKFGGQHALVPIKVGYYIAIGINNRNNDTDVNLFFKITKIATSSDPNINPTIYADCIENPDMLNNVWDKGMYDEVIAAINNRCNDSHADHPVYVANYREDYADINDVNDILDSNPEYINCSTIDELYDTIDNAFKDKKVANKQKLIMPLLLKNVDDGVEATAFAVLYDRTTNDSKDHRFCHVKCKLTKDQMFYYPDCSPNSGKCMNVEKLQKNLSRAYSGAIITSFRRMTPVI